MATLTIHKIVIGFMCNNVFSDFKNSYVVAKVTYLHKLGWQRGLCKAASGWPISFL